ncbi:MAG: hypothetical protein DCF30_14385 [Hyphomicrobiales bacterium]|nr:MAG: hypothetical protein DCF30_14385 [Hyphomicrobiales bacterium]
MLKDQFPATYRAVQLYRQMMGVAEVPASGVAAVPDNGPPQPSESQPTAAGAEPATASDLVIRLTVEAPAAHRSVDIAITIGTPAAVAEGRPPAKLSASRESVR